MKVLLIRPSQNLGEIAYEIIRKTNLSRYSGVMSRWIRRSMTGEQMPENDLASYVLFDPDYINRADAPGLPRRRGPARADRRPVRLNGRRPGRGSP